jgi:hypothetical protein
MNGGHHVQSLSQKTLLSFSGGVDDFQTFMDVVDHFQSPKDYKDDLYSLDRVDLFLVKHG